MKKIYLLMMLLMVGVIAKAQRTIQLQVSIDTPISAFNIITGSTVTPVYTIKNLGPDTLRTTDTLVFQDSGMDTTSAISVWATANIPMGSSVKMSGVSLTLLKVPFANLKAFFPSTGSIAKRLTPPFTNNTKYAWYAWVRGITPKTGTGTITFNAAGSLDTVHVWINKSTGINELSFEDPTTIKTYPNPASTQLSFEYNFTNKENATAQVLDIAGRTVLVKEFANNSGNQKFDLDVTSLNTGAYILQFIVGDKTMTSKFNVLK